MIRIVLLIAGLLAVALAYEAYRVFLAFERARPVLQRAVPFERVAGGASYLVAGDSTGVGTGGTAETSVAGRLASANPNASVRNISKNGLKVAGLLEKLRAEPNFKHQLILLQIGGNDILNFTSVSDVIRDLRLVFEEAKKRGESVLFMSTGDVGNAPAFGPVLSYLYSMRSKELRPLFIEESKKAGVVYVDLYTPKAEDPFALEPLIYHAEDGVHPSSAGYGVWYQKLERALER